MARVSTAESGSPTPTACERSRLTCSSRIWSPVNAYVAQLAHTGGDGVGNFVTCDQRVHYRSRAADRFARIGSEQHRTPLADARDLADFFEGQVVAVDVESFHGTFSDLSC